MTPLQRYQNDIDVNGFTTDPAQQTAVQHLDTLYHQLLAHKPQQRHTLVSKFSRFLGGAATQKDSPIQGLYFWGGVGRGKTYLMDVFFDCLPFERKMRTHFHRFMRRVHQELTLLKDVSNPLVIVANKIADEARIICFDEFFVVDIADAMILAGLLEHLFERGVVLVATSNIEPHHLYKNGLQRARFLPAIALLEKHTLVVNVDGGIDYRLRTLEQAELYHSPVNDESFAKLSQCFSSLVSHAEHCHENTLLDIEGRKIQAIKEADDVVWFDFYAVCDGPRSQNDYIELAKEYHTVILSGIPAFGEKNDDQARRFIYLVDEFYDRGVKLIMSAEKPFYELYGHGRLNFEFQRTVSRIQEMQSAEYLASEHKT